MRSRARFSQWLLALTALIWGCAFVAQRQGMEYIGPFTFLAARSLLAGVALIVFLPLLERLSGDKKPAPEQRRRLWCVGALFGLVLCVASALQQLGLMEASAGKAGFLTALYIVLVPLLGLFCGRKVGWWVWLCVAVATVGMYLLCVTEAFTVAPSDVLLLACALCFAVHILVIDRFSPGLSGVRLSCIQFFVCGGLALIPALLFEGLSADTLRALGEGWWPVVYAGLFSSGVAYTLQIVAQKHVEPTRASLIMCLESVFAALSGWLLLRERFSPRELIGCALVLVATLCCQLPWGKRQKSGNTAD